MPVKTKLTTKGFAEYLEAIATAGENVDEAADEALIAGADVLLDGMRRRAPEDTGNLKGELKRTEPRVDGNWHVIEIGLIQTDAETARYGTAQEYGWGPDNPARPYIRPTIDEDQRAARAAMVEKFKQRMGTK